MYTRKELVVDYDPDLNIECCICEKISNELVETNCGHIYCSHCFQNTNIQSPCKKCSQLIVTSFCPQSTVRFINRLTIMCENCYDEYVFNDQISHREKCVPKTVQCACGDSILYRLYDSHVKVCVLKGIPLNRHDDTFIIEQLKHNNRKISMLEKQVSEMSITTYVLKNYGYDDSEYNDLIQWNSKLTDREDDEEEEKYQQLQDKYVQYRRFYVSPYIDNKFISCYCKLMPLTLTHSTHNNLYHLYGHIEVYSSYEIPNCRGTHVPILLEKYDENICTILRGSTIYCGTTQQPTDLSKLIKNMYKYIDIHFSI